MYFSLDCMLTVGGRCFFERQAILEIIEAFFKGFFVILFIFFSCYSSNFAS